MTSIAPGRPSTSTPSDPNRRLYYRVLLAVLTVVPLGLIVPVVLRKPLGGVLALLIGVVLGVIFVVARPSTDSLIDDERAPAGPMAPGGTARPGPPSHGFLTPKPPRSASPDRPVTSAPPTVASSRTPLSAGPMVFEGGSVASRHPWRLPEGQAQSGIAADSACMGDLEIRAASIIGAGHRCTAPATARQDAYVLTRTRDGSHLVIAVADGLSSSARSETGARVAAGAGARLLAEQLQRSPGPQAVDAQQLFAKVAGEMVGVGQSRGIPIQDLCSLLVVAAVPVEPLPDGGRRVWTAQLGDVSLWLHGERGWSQATGGPKADIDGNTVDAVLPFNPDKVVAGPVDVPPRHGIAVVTDGFGDLLSDVAGVQDHFSRRWIRPPHPAVFVADLCADAPGQNDDRTAVVVWCGAPGGERTRA